MNIIKCKKMSSWGGVPYNLTMGYNVSNIYKKEGKTGSDCIRSTVVFSVF